MTESGIVIQARTGSTRLPNKMLLPFYENKGIFEIILHRLKESNISIPIILATTQNKSDNQLIEIAKKYGFSYYTGSEENVLNRFIETAEHFKIDNIIRLCADNPFVDLNAVEDQINNFKNKYDYWCYSTNNYTPTIKTGFGFWTEMVTLGTLKKIASLTDDSIYQEHVTNYIYTHPNIFNIHFEKINQSIEDVSELRLTVDTKSDFELLKEIYDVLKSKNIEFSAIEISKTVKENPQWLTIMKAETLKNIK